MLGTTTSIALAALVCNCQTESAEVLEATESIQDESGTDNMQAQLYRFLQETRADANKQGETYVSEKSKLLEKSGGSLDTADDATASYIEQCKKVASEKKQKDHLSARDQLLKKIESGKEDDGVKFVTQEEAEQQQVQLTTAINALTHSLKKASKVVEDQTDVANREQKIKDAYNAVNQNNTKSDGYETEKPSDWTSDDLAEIAQCSATSPNVMDGTGNCNSTTRSYMAYTKITSKTSAQYVLVNSEDAYTSDDGFRMYKGRYCIAVGSGYTQKIGTKIDLVFADGSILKCVLGECKAYEDTDAETHKYCFRDGSVAEFVIDDEKFNINTKHNPVNTALNQYGKIIKVVVISE